MNLPDKLPEDVVAMIDHGNGEVEFIYFPYPIKTRWPNITVDSYSFRELSMSEKFYKQAVAFLDAAEALCERACQENRKPSWSQASVCYYNLHIATELFLKACISCSKGSAEASHEIPELLKKYREILPDKKFEFVSIWSMSWKDMETLLKQKIVNRVDRHPDQLFRYGMDREGEPSSGTYFFTPNQFYSYVIYVRKIWQSSWGHISGR